MKKLLFLLVLLPLLGIEAKAQVESMFGERAVSLAGKVVRAWDAGSGLAVYDMAGKEVLAVAASGRNVEIDMAGQPSGTYVVRVETEKGTAARKLIVGK